MTDYKAIWSLVIVHSYYTDGVCHDCRVTIPATTANLLKRRGLIWKMIAPNRWALLAADGGSMHPDDTFEFELAFLHPLLPYITEVPELTPGLAISLPCTGTESPFESPFTGYPRVQARPGVQFRILLSAGNLSEKEGVTKLTLHPPTCQWEYVFLFRHSNADKLLELHDKEHLLTFNQEISHEYLGLPAQYFRSAEKLPLARQPKSKIRLSEILPTGKKELYACLPPPVPGEFIDAPPGVVRRVIYL